MARILASRAPRLAVTLTALAAMAAVMAYVVMHTPGSP